MRNWWRTPATLVAGLLGALLFDALALPLPWLLGPMTVAAGLGRAGLALGVAEPVRVAALPVVAVALGACVNTGLTMRLDALVLTVPVVLASVLAAGAASIAWLRRRGGLPTVTAFFAGVPGAVNQVMVLAPPAGASMPTVGMVHGTRLFLVLGVVSVAATTLNDGSFSGAVAGEPSSLLDVLLLILCCVAGPPVAARLRLRAPIMTGPLLLSAGLHLLGLTSAQVPSPFLPLAQLVIGAAVGARFGRLPFAALNAEFRLTLHMMGAMLAALTAVAAGLAWITGVPLAACLLILAPGGFGNMTLVAIAIGIDPAFVALHHVLRVMMLYSLVPWLLRRPRLVPFLCRSGDCRPVEPVDEGRAMGIPWTGRRARPSGQPQG